MKGVPRSMPIVVIVVGAELADMGRAPLGCSTHKAYAIAGGSTAGPVTAKLAAIPAGESPANRDAMGRAARTMAPSSLQRINGAPHATAERFEQIPHNSRTRCNTDSRDRDGQSSWLVAGIVPGVERQPLKKLAVDESALLKLLNRWREEAEQAGHRIKRIAVAFEAGRDGFWLARWLRTRGIETHVIHASSVAVSREHRRAKTDRLDTELLKRAFLGWLRGERDHCKMVAIPTTKDEDAKRPNRERESLVGEQSRIVNRMKATLTRLGIRGFNPKLKKAAERLDGLRTPEGAQHAG